MEENTKKRSLLFEAGLSYSLAALLPVCLSLVVLIICRAAAGEDFAESNLFSYISYLLPQIGIAAVALVYFRRSGKTGKFLYTVPEKPWYFAVAVLLSFGLFSLSELNGLFLGLFERAGYRLPESTLPDLSGWYLLPAVLIIALLPAIFEETLFRGIQVRSMKESGWGTASVVFLSGALFALYHGNPAQTVYQFICGVCYALLAVRSRSPFPTMLAHFLNNATILCMLSAGFEELVPAAHALWFYLLSGASLIASVLILVFIGGKDGQKGMKGGKQYFLAAGVGIAVCAVEWVVMLAEGFL